MPPSSARQTRPTSDFSLPGTAFLLVAAATLTPQPALAEITDGIWSRGDGQARVRIAPCGAALCAINVWIKSPGDEKVGDRLIMSVKQTSPGKYTGSSYDPQRKLRFSTTITVNGNRMTTSGCVLGGLVCKSQQWTRR